MEWKWKRACLPFSAALPYPARQPSRAFFLPFSSPPAQASWATRLLGFNAQSLLPGTVWAVIGTGTTGRQTSWRHGLGLPAAGCPARGASVLFWSDCHMNRLLSLLNRRLYRILDELVSLLIFDGLFGLIHC